MVAMPVFATPEVQPDTISRTDTSSSMQAIEEIIISAFRLPANWLDISASVGYITQETLAKGVLLTPVEALNSVSGINMHHGSLNTNRLTIRGVGSRSPYSTYKIKAYFGDIPLTTGDGETTLEDLETSGVSKVEIIKGPTSTVYGAGLGGAIIFYPVFPTQDFIKIENTAGSFNTSKQTFSAGTTLKNASVYALLSNLEREGYRKNNRTTRKNFLVHSTLFKGDKVSASVLARLTKMKAFIPSSINRRMFEETPWKAANNWKEVKGFEDYTTGQAGISAKTNTGTLSNATVSVFGQFREADELRPFNKLVESSWAVGTRGNFQQAFKIDALGIKLVAGFEIFRETYKWGTFSNGEGSQLSDNKENRDYENFFIQGEITKVNKFNLSVGANLNRTRYRYLDSFLANGDQSGKHSYDPVVSQRLGINYKILKNLAVFSNLSHGFSPPTLEETLYPEGNINPNIKPEKGWNLEAGIKGNIGNWATFSASYYRMYVSDLLVARRTAEDAYVGVNAGRSVHPGLESFIQGFLTTPGAYPSVSFYANTTLANYHFTDFVDDGKDYSGNQLPGTTKFSGNVGLSFSVNETMDIKLSQHLSGKMPVNDLNSGYTDPYGVTNLNVVFHKNWNKLHFNLKAGANNILDVNHASMLAVNSPSFGGNAPRYFYPGNPRNYYLSVSIGFQNSGKHP